MSTGTVYITLASEASTDRPSDDLAGLAVVVAR